MTTITISADENKYEAWPSLIQLANKDLITFYRTADTNTHLYEPSGKIVCKKSNDQGLTWGDEVVVSKHGETTDNRCNTVIVFDNNSIETIIVITVLLDDGEPGHIYQTRSTDGGITWSIPSLISEKRGITNNIKELSNGELIFTAYGYNKVNTTVFLTGTIYLYKSNDGGLNWTEYIVHDNDGAGQCNESAVIETKTNGHYTGGMLIISRANPVSDPQYRKFRSTDYGETWTEEDNETGLIDSYKCTKLELYRPVPNIILCSYFETTIYSTAIIVSIDEGLTWENKVLIPLEGVGGKGYPDTILLNNTWTLATATCVNSVYSNVHINFTSFKLFKEYLTTLYRLRVTNRTVVSNRRLR